MRRELPGLGDDTPGGRVVLLTGLSGAGKSPIARALASQLETRQTRYVTLLDGDEIRRTISPELGFGRADRELSVRRIGWIAALVARHEGIAVCAVIAPYASTRDDVRTMATESGAQFTLIHVATPLEVCEARDPEGLYARARVGEVEGMTG